MGGELEKRYSFVSGFLADEYPTLQMETGERAPAISAEFEVIRSQWTNKQLRDTFMRRVQGYQGYRGYGVMR
jgi:hypothetical protein